LVERLHREDVLVRLLGLGDVAEVVFERLGEPLADGALNDGIGVRAEDVRVCVRESLEAGVDDARKTRCFVSALLVERVLLERADEDLERRRPVEQLLLGELGDLIVRREPIFFAALAALIGISRDVNELRFVDAPELR